MTMVKKAQASAADWLARFRSNAYRNRIPISATLELTSRCNLRCRHCYLGNQTEQHRKRSLERDTDAVKASLKEWAEAGCLYLLITGGDPMMRKDFPEVYRYARELGMVVTVFCDGILVTDKILALFRELPPRRVEISIYGATAETYEYITRVPGSHGRAWKGIHRLIDADIRVVLKTVLMKPNAHELEDMARQAAERGLEFRYDGAIFPCLPDSSREPIDLRVAPEEIVARDTATPERAAMWKEKIEATARQPDTDRLYTCGAGATGFYSDPFGNLSPCLMTTHYRYQQDGRPFDEVWHRDLAEIRQRKKTRTDGCFSGPLRGACTHCPAFNYLETGDEEKDSEYVLKTTLLRYQAVTCNTSKGGSDTHGSATQESST